MIGGEGHRGGKEAALAVLQILVASVTWGPGKAGLTLGPQPHTSGLHR